MKIVLVFVCTLYLAQATYLSEQDVNEVSEFLEALDQANEAASEMVEAAETEEARDWECLPLHSSCENDCTCCENHHCHCPYKNVNKVVKVGTALAQAPSWVKIPKALLRCSCQRNDKEGKVNTCPKYGKVGKSKKGRKG
uniref:Tx-3 n=1 Tax=Oxyopes takobius TaxID=666126 RepID=W0LQ84_OXYTA|nr:Tx-3 precursor [Oxyopes takobius]